MRLDVCKIVTAVSALTVFFPTPKFSLPVAITILTLFQTGIWGILLVIAYYGFFAYLVLSMIKQFSGKMDAVLTIVSILFYCIFYSFQIKALLSYGDTLAYVTFSIFYISSIITIILILRNVFLNPSLPRNNRHD